MCLDYAQDEKDKQFIKKLIKYYEKVEKTRILNIHFVKYFKFLGGKNLARKMCKEIILFHFPIIAYIAFKLG